MTGARLAAPDVSRHRKKSAAFNLAGTSISQGIVVITSPLLARIYGPGPLGLALLAISVAGVISIVASLRLEQGLLSARLHKHSAGLAAWAVGLRMGTGLLAFVGVLTWVFLSPAGWAADQTGVALLAPLVLLMAGHMQIGEILATRRGNFGSIATSRILSVGATVSFQLALAFVFPLKASAFLLGRIGGQAIAALFLAIKCVPRRIRFPRWKELKDAAREGRPIAAQTAPANLINELVREGPLWVLSFVFGGVVAGYYGLMNRLVRMPVQVIGRALGQVFVHELRVGDFHGHSAKRLISDTVRATSLIGAIIGVTLATSGDHLVAWAFGARWQGAGIYVQILGVGLAVRLVASPISQYLVARNLNRVQLRFQAINLLLSALLVGASLWFGRPEAVLVALVAADFLKYTILMGVIGNKEGISLGSWLSIIAPAILSALVLGTGQLALRWIVGGIVAAMAAGLAGGAACLVWLLVWRKAANE